MSRSLTGYILSIVSNVSLIFEFIPYVYRHDYITYRVPKVAYTSTGNLINSLYDLVNY